MVYDGGSANSAISCSTRNAVHLFGFGENSHSPKLTEIGLGDLVFIGVVAVADDHQVSLGAGAVGCLAVDDLGANVRAARLTSSTIVVLRPAIRSASVRLCCLLMPTISGVHVLRRGS
jgi:hypothetical protein